MCIPVNTAFFWTKWLTLIKVTSHTQIAWCTHQMNYRNLHAVIKTTRVLSTKTTLHFLLYVVDSLPSASSIQTYDCCCWFLEIYTYNCRKIRPLEYSGKLAVQLDSIPCIRSHAIRWINLYRSVAGYSAHSRFDSCKLAWEQQHTMTVTTVTLENRNEKSPPPFTISNYNPVATMTVTTVTLESRNIISFITHRATLPFWIHERLLSLCFPQEFEDKDWINI